MNYNITLKCGECENIECRIGELIKSDDGCVREVPEDIYLNYFHLLNEVWPFCKKDVFYSDVINACENVYKCKVIKKNGKNFIPKQLV